MWRPSGSGAARTLVLLHGTGGDEHDLHPHAKALDPDANVLSLRGNVPENGMPRFFKRLAMGVLDLDDLGARTIELAAFVRAAGEAYGFALDSVVIVGFSNGANIGVATLYTAPEVCRGAVLIRAMLPYEPTEALALGGKDVLLLAGASDPYSQAPITDDLAAILRAGGADVKVNYARAGHELTMEDVGAARAWLAMLDDA